MDDESHAAELDSYGPGADLMISLFAIALLLLALVGAGQQFETFSAAAATRPPATTPPSTEGAAPPPLQIVALAKAATRFRGSPRGGARAPARGDRTGG